MKTIRQNVFETNSSSMHALALFSSEEFKLFKEGKIFVKPYENEVCTPESLAKAYNKSKDEKYPEVSVEDMAKYSYEFKNGSRDEIPEDIDDFLCDECLTSYDEIDTDVITIERKIGDDIYTAISWEDYR